MIFIAFYCSRVRIYLFLPTRLPIKPDYGFVVLSKGSDMMTPGKIPFMYGGGSICP
jgi:hypothetical protein